MEDNKKKDSRIQKTSEQKTGTGSGRFSGATENKNRRKVNYSGGYAEKNEDNYFAFSGCCVNHFTINCAGNKI